MEKEGIIDQAELRRLQKEKELVDIKKRVDDKKDKTGRGIDEGIKEGVAVFNALGLHTSQSCEGHFGGSHGTPTPWIEISANEPDDENWYENEETRDRVTKEKDELMLRAINLLDEFYKERPTSYDVRLGFDHVGYRFRIQSVGAEVFDESTKGFAYENRAEKAAEYKKEFGDFVNFLKNKYLEN